MSLLHIIRAAVNPTAAPDQVGVHWVNTVTKQTFFSVGTGVVGDWKELGAAGGGGGSTKSSQSVRATDFVGYGSVALAIPQLSTVRAAIQEGATPLFTYSSDATDGTKITILAKCRLTMSFTFNSPPGVLFGISLNTGDVTAAFNGRSNAERLALAYGDGSNNLILPATTHGIFNSGNILRPHTDLQTPPAPSRVILTVEAQEI